MNLSSGSLQRFPNIWIDISLIENAAQGPDRDLVFSGDDCGIYDGPLAPRELYVATLLRDFLESCGLKPALDLSERLRAKPTQLRPR